MWRRPLPTHGDTAVRVVLVPEAGLAHSLAHTGVHSTGERPGHGARTEVEVDLVLVKGYRGLGEVVGGGGPVGGAGGVVVHYHNGRPVNLTAGGPRLAPGLGPPEGRRVVDVVDRDHGAAPGLHMPRVVPLPLDPLPLDRVVDLEARALALLPALPALAGNSIICVTG